MPPSREAIGQSFWRKSGPTKCCWADDDDSGGGGGDDDDDDGYTSWVPKSFAVPLTVRTSNVTELYCDHSH